jgi:hypothetical protein
MKGRVSILCIAALLASITLIAFALNASASSDSGTVSVDAGETHIISFDANSGDMDWEVKVYGDYFSGEYEHTGVDMEIRYADDDELVYMLIDVEDDTGTQYLDYSGEYEFLLTNNNDFSVEVYYNFVYEDYVFTACCCGGAIFAPLVLLGVPIIVLTVVKKKNKK